MISPVSGHIVVEPQKKEKITSSGIVLATSHDEKPQLGKVLSIGSEYTSDYGTKKSAPCAVGDTVIYKEWGGKEYKDGDQDLIILKFDDIMAIVK
ncbi:co-chaperone GroES [Candidatus Shapirobacteria bacterium]|nr:co-chaperone GroES [Candidatus Shapirobacteria bacterium]